jgi:prepilin-type N-terminal cleavage/methylation domain-containing protein
MSKPLAKQLGFTIVELLIVIVVIAILAVFTIVAYNGIQARAQAAAAQFALEQTSKKLALYAVDNSSYPVDLPTVGINGTNGTSFQYSVNNGVTPQTYCVTATNGTTAYMISSTNTIPQSGVCPGHTAPGGSGTVAGNGGVVTTFAGSGTAGLLDGAAATARFNTPYGVAVDSSGNVYVADTLNSLIRKITPTGTVSTFAGSGTAGFLDGAAGTAKFNYPQALAVDTTGNVYVADTANNRIRKITSTGTVSTLAGSGVAGSAEGTGTAAQFSNSFGIAVDSSGNVYVADTNNQRIRKITPGGVVMTLAGSTGGYANGTGAAAQFLNPQGVAVDSSGNVYVADGNNNRIRKITPGGVVTTLAGSGTAAFADGTGVNASFSAPRGIAADSAGNVYVADSTNKRIRLVR